MTAPQHDAFADLGDLDRWVAWRNEKRGPEGKPTKVPYGTSDRRARADVSATWISRHQAEAAAKRLVNGAGGGIGIELGDLGHDVYLAGIDLDTCLDSGGLAAWAGDLLAAFPSYAERSPSGSGVKGYAYLMSEHVRPFLDRLGVEFDRLGHAPVGWRQRRRSWAGCRVLYRKAIFRRDRRSLAGTAGSHRTPRLVGP